MISFIPSGGGPLLLPLAPSHDGTRCYSLNLEPGLYQLSVIADGKAFPWDSLYYEMHEFGNEGARTGPWDFKPCVGSPLVPAFWVYLNEEKLGLWPFQRLSVEDLEARIFRGNMAFRVTCRGENRLRLVPYLDNPVEWLSCVLQSDPVDRLEDLPFDIAQSVERLIQRKWQSGEYWNAKRQLLDGSLKEFVPLLKQSLSWVLDSTRKAELDAEGRSRNVDEPGPLDMTVCIAGWHLFGDRVARDLALDLLDKQVQLAGWGRPAEDIYGWDGDLVAIDPMRACIQAYFGLAEELDVEQRRIVLDKIRYQGNRFITMALLMRDYWGGSVLQDHGWRAILGFSECAINLLGELDEAVQWLEFLVPRFRRALVAMPLDGHLPTSSYGCPALYVTPLARLRQAWLEVSGEDLYTVAPVEAVLKNLGAYIQTPETEVLLTGSNLFLCQLAEKYQSPEAVHWLEKSNSITQEQLCESCFSYRWYAQGLYEGFFYYPSSLLTQSRAPQQKTLYYFEDVGQVIYREPGINGMHIRFQCGPWLGYNAYFKSDNPCDRMCVAPGPGHFTIASGDRELLVRPDSNYALRSNGHNSLLINGCGQVGGDIDYPMSLPSWRWRGEQVTTFRHYEKTGEAFYRLNLQPLYSEKLGVLHYTRDFEISGDGILTCRDELLLKEPLPLCWLFHGMEENGIEFLSSLNCRFGEVLELKVRRTNTALIATTQPTKVVFSYTGSGKKFTHAAFESLAPTRAAMVEFEFRLVS